MQFENLNYCFIFVAICAKPKTIHTQQATVSDKKIQIGNIKGVYPYALPLQDKPQQPSDLTVIRFQKGLSKLHEAEVAMFNGLTRPIERFIENHARPSLKFHGLSIQVEQSSCCVEIVGGL